MEGLEDVTRIIGIDNGNAGTIVCSTAQPDERREFLFRQLCCILLMLLYNTHSKYICSHAYVAGTIVKYYCGLSCPTVAAIL